MQVESIRVFIPSKNYEESQSFYHAMGFKMGKVSNDLSIFESENCTFFLQRFYSKEFANNLMLQIAVKDIEEAFELISSIKGFNIKFEPIKNEPWGKVVYLWRPSGELWHITEFNCL